MVLLAFFGLTVGALGILATVTLSPIGLLAVLVLLGASNWGWNSARDILISEVAPADREGRTFGYLHTISHLFSAAAPVAIGAIAGETSLRSIFLVLAIAVVVALVAIASLFSQRVYTPPPDMS